MSKFTDTLRGLAGVGERLEAAQARGETDPLRLVDVMLDGQFLHEGDNQWWMLFGMTEKPTNRAQLDGAWKRWAARNHPDKGGDAISFGHMKALHDRMRERLPG